MDMDILEPSMIVELTRAETLRPLGSGKGAVCRVFSTCIGGRESFRSEYDLLRGLAISLSRPSLDATLSPTEFLLLSTWSGLAATFSSSASAMLKVVLSGTGEGGIGSIITGLARG